MFDPELLRAFAAVADLSSFTRAAERLNSTQSTVSFQIKRLEQQAGRALLARTTRQVTLTPDGETLLGYARGILRLQDAARREFAALDGLAGSVRLGTSEDFASGGLAQALAAFRRSHPRVRLTVEVGMSRNLVQALDNFDLDLVLAKRQANETRGEVLWREPIVWAYGRDQERLDPAAPLPLAFFPEPCVYRQAALDRLRAEDRTYEIVYVSPSFSGVKAAAAAGLAITPLPVSVMTPQLRTVGAEEGAPTLPDGEFVLFHREGDRQDPIVVQLAEALRSVRL
ncbi:LysR family transcriptional regulator [Aliidongia dinghuensis]|uniref:LysR family transcriptional regulator n=2 Tax=Aliidongia dinghuensis TaxID=1867774 RepID=A0A8J2YS85_9PROT|nr:LysR family transcriptional regulator [Aliidongia dinghuensis]